ncbi:hypothetical protein ACP70R_026123 [Stipagrostis hirtigluma subsp. patula]
MELLLLPSRGATARPLLPTTSLPRRAGSSTARPAAGSSNVEVIDATATSSSSGVAKNRQEWRGGAAGGLGLDLSDEMRRGMMWRMLAPPAAAVAADAAFLRLLDRADAPAWAAAAGSAALFAAGLLGVHYGFLSSRWDASESGSLVGWDLAVRHWSAMTMAKDSSLQEVEEEDDDEDEEEDEEDEDEYYYEEEEEEEEEEVDSD